MNDDLPTYVLLIDRDDHERRYYAQHLRQRHFVVQEAANGRTAFDVFKSSPVDCVVLEIDLPDMSGFEILTKLVPAASSPEIPVIVLSHIMSESLFDLAVKNGAQFAMRKSMTSPDLLESNIQRAISAVPTERKRASAA